MDYKLERENRGWTQKQLSEKSGVSIQTIFNLEKGRKIKESTKRKIAKALCPQPTPGQIDLLSAREAHNKTTQARNKIHAMKDILSEVETAAEKGQGSIVWRGEISGLARKTLSTLGYHLKPMGVGVLTIEWEQAE